MKVLIELDEAAALSIAELVWNAGGTAQILHEPPNESDPTEL